MVTVYQFPQIHRFGRIQGIHRARQVAFILDAGVSAADSFETVGGVETHQIARMLAILEFAHRPAIGRRATRKCRALSVGVGEDSVELVIADARELNFARRLFRAQSPIGIYIGRQQQRARRQQKQGDRGDAARALRSRSRRRRRRRMAARRHKIPASPKTAISTVNVMGTLTGAGTEPHGTNKNT